jgi:ribonuclease D
MSHKLHRGDLPEGISFGSAVAVDTEAMGLNPHRDRLCLVQLSAGDGDAHLVQLAPGAYEAPRLKALMADPTVTKLFHFARFDLAMIYHYLGVMAGPVYCTKIASRLVRTFTDRHGLRDLCKDLLGVDLSKQQQSSDWGAATLRRDRCAAPARAARQARCDVGARGANRAGAVHLRLPADARIA